MATVPVLTVIGISLIRPFILKSTIMRGKFGWAETVTSCLKVLGILILVMRLSVLPGLVHSLPIPVIRPPPISSFILRGILARR
jgi:hypothetical protein